MHYKDKENKLHHLDSPEYEYLLPQSTRRQQ